MTTILIMLLSVTFLSSLAVDWSCPETALPDWER